ncbi:FAD-dependent oxidoreductase [Massilia sp. DD77]|uniref:FAD-dependent oxidoreductase n=1 Tax=Massilia sp. DD77 TaxID=3109349 RepID=UPI0030001CB4
MSAADLHIVGAGPAGLSAAHSAIVAGARVCLIDNDHAAGGQVWRGGPAAWTDPRARDIWKTLQAHPNFTHLRGAQVIGSAGADSLLLEAGGQALRLDVARLLVCSGARELFLPFPGWTLPGVTGAGGLQALIKGGMPVADKRIVVAGSGPLLLATAATAIEAGAKVVAIVEHQGLARLSRFGLGLLFRHQDKIRQALALFARLRKIPYFTGGRIVEARGLDAVRSLVVTTGRARQEFACDLVAAGFGLVPDIDLACAMGCETAGGAIAVDALQKTSRPGIWAAGECTGIGGVDKAIAEGRIAALDALETSPSAQDRAALGRSHDFAALLARSFVPGDSLKAMCRPETIVCRCEDVAAASLAPHRGWREAKLATRVGMGPCQGKTCGPACQFLFGWAPPAPRMPIVPAGARALSQIE